MVNNMRCPVCQNNTFGENDYEYDICEECFWEYDVWQVENPDEDGGANCHSLNEYKKIYEKQKAINHNFSCKNTDDRDLMVKLDHSD